MLWVIMGDFNESLIGEDKFRGRPVSVNRSLLLKKCLDKCNMIDLGFSGPRFTWTIRREVQGLIQERIDIIFVSPRWCLLYLEARVTHLTRCHSNHCPVLLEMQSGAPLFQVKPFKFQKFWLFDQTFPKVVANDWNQVLLLRDAIDKFQKEASLWNKSYFGNIFAKKRKLWLG